MINLRKLELNDLKVYAYWKSSEHSYHSLNDSCFKKFLKRELRI